MQASQAVAPQKLLSDTYGVYFRLRTGVKVLVEDCKATMTVLELKEEISNYDKGLPVAEQRLSFKGQPIGDKNTIGCVCVAAVVRIRVHGITS